MTPHDEIERLKKDVIILQTLGQFEAAAHQALLGAFLHSIGSGAHGAQAAAAMETAYRQTVEHSINEIMADVADEHPDLATELHAIF